MKQLYLDIKSKLLEATSFKHIAIWNNQVELLASEDGYNSYTCALPALFVELISPVDIVQLGDGVQMYDPMIVRIHIVNDFYHDGANMEQNTAIFDLRDEVYLLMQKYEPDGAVAFVRTQEEQDTDHPNLYHFVQTYQTNYIDTTRRMYGEIEKEPPTDLEITGTFEE